MLHAAGRSNFGATGPALNDFNVIALVLFRLVVIAVFLTVVVVKPGVGDMANLHLAYWPVLCGELFKFNLF